MGDFETGTPELVTAADQMVATNEDLQEYGRQLALSVDSVQGAGKGNAAVAFMTPPASAAPSCVAQSVKAEHEEVVEVRGRREPRDARPLLDAQLLRQRRARVPVSRRRHG